MRVRVEHTTPDTGSYRTARVGSLFNADAVGADVTIDADLPIDGEHPPASPDGTPWRLGVVVGPSGSGKTTIGRALWPDVGVHDPLAGWPADAAIVDAIAPGADIDTVTAALAAVGLGDVPAWLRPHRVLSNGEGFRADLARIVAERPARVIVDEFTSVVDRQVARVGAGAFAKAWRRGPHAEAVLLTCHYDVLDWLDPDWIYDTETRRFHARGSVQPGTGLPGRTGEGWYARPRLDVEIRQGGWDLWPVFKPHHYLAAGPMPFGTAYVAFIDGEPVMHLGVSSKSVGKGRVEARACRMVVLPEWQGAGLGMRVLNHVAGEYLAHGGHLQRPCTTLFHTSHPQLCAALRRDPRWRQLSAVLHGENKLDSQASIRKSGGVSASAGGIGFGGHFRAVQGFRYVGTPEDRARARATVTALQEATP